MSDAPLHVVVPAVARPADWPRDPTEALGEPGAFPFTRGVYAEGHQGDPEYLLIGPVLLEAFELPSRVFWGGRQRLAVHRLPGGRGRPPGL